MNDQARIGDNGESTGITGDCGRCGVELRSLLKLGVDLGGTKVEMALVDAKDRILSVRSITRCCVGVTDVVD